MQVSKDTGLQDLIALAGKGQFTSRTTQDMYAGYLLLLLLTVNDNGLSTRTSKSRLMGKNDTKVTNTAAYVACVEAMAFATNHYKGSIAGMVQAYGARVLFFHKLKDDKLKNPHWTRLEVKEINPEWVQMSFARTCRDNHEDMSLIQSNTPCPELTQIIMALAKDSIYSYKDVFNDLSRYIADSTDSDEQELWATLTDLVSPVQEMLITHWAYNLGLISSPVAKALVDGTLFTKYELRNQPEVVKDLIVDISDQMNLGPYLNLDEELNRLGFTPTPYGCILDVYDEWKDGALH